MKLFATPQTINLPDGSISINVQQITSEYIDNRLKTLEVMTKLDIDVVIKIVYESKSKLDAIKNLSSQYDLSDSIADYILDIELSQLGNYRNDSAFRNSEIAKWVTLKSIID